MKHPKAKLIICVALACALLLALALLYIGVYGATGEQQNATEVASKLEGIGTSITNLLETNESVVQDYIQQTRNDVNLTAMSLRGVVAREGDAAIRSYENGCVIRNSPDGPILPEDSAALPLPEPRPMENPPFQLPASAPFEDDIGAFWASDTNPSGGAEGEDDAAYRLCTYKRIDGAYYYLSFTPAADIRRHINAHADLAGAMHSIEENYACRIAAFEDSTEEKRLFYCSEPFGQGYAVIQDMGIQPEALSDPAVATIDGTDYIYAVSRPFPVEGMEASNGIASFRVVYLAPVRELMKGFAGKGATLAGVSLIIFAVLIVWVFSAMEVVRKRVVSQSQRRRYGPARARLITVSIGVIGFVAILASSLFSDILSDVYARTQGNQGVLDTLHMMQEDYNNRADSYDRQREALYTGYATRIAALLVDYPELRTAEALSEMNRTIGSDYLMLFDDKGRQTLSSARYTLLKFGTTPDSTTYDFRRLISGVPTIVHETCTDEVTGLERQLIGVSMDDGDVSDGYASLIVALEPDRGTRLSGGEIMRLLTNSRNMILTIDRQTGTILQSSDAALVGKNAMELGMPEGSLRDGFMDFFTLNGGRWYGCSTEFNGAIDYCASRVDSMIGDNLINGLRNALVFLAAYVLLAIAVLWGYTDANVDALGGIVVDDAEWLTRQDAIANADQKGRRTGLLSRIRDSWATMSPERRAWRMLGALLVAGLLMLTSGLGGRGAGGAEIISYVMSGRWTPGLNIFALTRIVLLIEGAVLAILIVGAVAGLISTMMEAKGRTITKLLGSLLQYIIAIVALFGAFDALGFDTRTLLASLGIFSLAISLGAKDLVSDIFSGVGLVFSGEYQIGDIVQIDGFKGRVWEIGVRSTMLVSMDGHIKNINNRDISNVTNLSRLNTWYTMQISVNYHQPLDQVEDILARELPAIGKNIDEITQGPIYRGITQVGSGKVTLALAAECREQDLTAVRSKLNLAILRLFEHNKISIS